MGEEIVAASDGGERGEISANASPSKGTLKKEKPLCHVCKVNVSKYTCPGCAAATCSLACCKQHKVAMNCDGKRSNTAFVPAASFGEKQLYRDLHFLNSVEECADLAKRSVDASPNARGGKRRRKTNLPFRVRQLKQRAKKRNTILDIMPSGMTRRKDNTSYYDAKRDEIKWKVEWTFRDGDLNLSLEDRAVSEKATWKHCLSRHLEPSSNTLESDAIVLHRLHSFSSALEDNRISLSLEIMPQDDDDNHGKSGANAKTINIADTIRATLAGQKIVEHPRVAVTLIRGERNEK